MLFHLPSLRSSKSCDFLLDFVVSVLPLLAEMSQLTLGRLTGWLTAGLVFSKRLCLSAFLFIELTPVILLLFRILAKETEKLYFLMLMIVYSSECN